MVYVRIESGICGLHTEVRASRTQRKGVSIALQSDCKKVTTLGDGLQKLDLMDVLKNPINKNPVYENAGRCKLHSSCPVPCGVIKAAEVELGLALMKDVRIVFQHGNEPIENAVPSEKSPISDNWSERD